MTKNVKTMSVKKGRETRYYIVSIETGEILDDAQGYGYKTPQKAYAAWAYKNRTKEEINKKRKRDRAVRKWMKEHKTEVETLECFAFEIWKGSWGPNDRFDAKFVTKQLAEWGYTDLPFTGKDYIYALKHKPL